MTPQNASELLNALAPALQAAAKNVVRHAYGPEGLPWHTPFADLEQMAVSVGDQLAREILQRALQAQADRPRPDDLNVCPSCAGPLQERPGQARDLQTGPGEVLWHEPSAYCPRCRRAFSPSGQEPGPGLLPR
jgi:hypothetical protein